LRIDSDNIFESELILELSGVHQISRDTSGYEINLCLSCLRAIEKGKTPALALANCTYLGSVPSELQYLTPIEESMVALCRAKCWIVQLSEQDDHDPDHTFPHIQRGFHGNIIIYPQQPQQIATILPPSVEQITSPICVIFVGSSPPSHEWL
jgi:hypothetical protein